MPKEWTFDKPIPRGYFAKAEDFPKDFEARAKERLRRKRIRREERASLHYELGRYLLIVTDRQSEAVFEFRRASEICDSDSTRHADCERQITNCFEAIGSRGVEQQIVTIAGIQDNEERPWMERIYTRGGDYLGLGLMVNTYLIRTYRIWTLHLYA